MRSSSIVLSLIAAVAICPANVIAAPADDLVGRPLVLEHNEVEIAATVEANLAGGQVEKPLSIAPDVWWGITPRLTIGVIHSDASVDQIQPGASFCLHTHDINGLCDRAYRGSGLDADYSVYDDGTWAIAPRARFLIRDIDPTTMALTFGSQVRWHHGRFAVRGDPYMQFGIYNAQLGNRNRVVVPVYLEMQPIRRIELAIQTGFQSDLAVIRDGWHIPAGFIVSGRVPYGFEVGAEAGFPSALGPQNDIKQRALFVTLTWRSHGS